jgi:hypothetical protein
MNAVQQRPMRLILEAVAVEMVRRAVQTLR